MQVIGLLLMGFALIFVIALIASLPFWLLWNWLMPGIFSLPSITWLQALGLLVMCGFLFKSSSSSTSKS